MEGNVQKIREAVPEADLIRVLEMRRQRGAELMDVNQRGIYQVDYRGLARRMVFWLILERYRLNVNEKAN
jgi:hypothetical protein